MKALVTGGAGFIGSHLAAALGATHEVRILDDLSTGHRRNLEGLDVEFIEGSITDPRAVAAAVAGVDCIFHLAAMVSVPLSVQRPRECVDLNVLGLLNVLEAAAAASVRRLVFSSSAAIYGDNPASPLHEDLAPRPRSPYAVTKLDGEYYCDHYHRDGRLETACLRYFNVFGPRQDPASAYAAAVPIFIRQALASAPLTVFGDGGQTRDFVHVRDVVAANRFAAFTPGVTGVFNVGYGGSMTILDLARRILAATGSASPIVHAPVRAGDVRHSRADHSRLRAAGFVPVSNLERGLAETVAFFRHQAAGNT
jgi:UDP-glucose 4-epimerase